MNTVIRILKNIKITIQAFLYYFYNHFISYIPLYSIRHFYLRTVLKIKIGKSSAIHMGCFFTGNSITIGNNCVINRKTYLDGRFGIKIGNNISISPECYLLSLTHNPNDEKFLAVGKALQIDDYAWIGARAILLPGVHLSRGVIVGAGSVVTKSVLEDNQIIGGIPAKFLNNRDIKKYDYSLSYFPIFDTDITFI